jgi:hypothetical protein
MHKTLVIVFCIALLSCQSQPASKLINAEGKTIRERFNTPEGFIREDDNTTAYDNFLRGFLLQPNGAKVYTHSGSLKQPDNVYDAVLDIDVGTKDLQQCADAVMRLRAEYLFANKLYEKIHFNFTNGKKAEFLKYAEGYRFNLKTNSWNKTTAKDYSKKSFRAYMDLVFNYAGSLSLSRELKSVDVKDIKVGDVFIKGGSPGHAVTVVDVAINPKTKEKIFIIAQSYMPAQNIHILKNFNSRNTSPWYSANFGESLKTPEWVFEKGQLMRFKD